MKHSKMQFQIDQLRQEKTITWVQSIAVLAFILFVMSFFESLIRFILPTQQQIFAAAAYLSYIPLIAFAIGALFFIYSIVMNVLRAGKIKQLEQEMLTIDDSCECGGDCGCGDDHWEELEELDKMVEKAMAESKAEAKTPAATKKVASKPKKAKKTASKKK
jgi:hypothetical protein